MCLCFWNFLWNWRLTVKHTCWKKKVCDYHGNFHQVFRTGMLPLSVGKSLFHAREPNGMIPGLIHKKHSDFSEHETPQLWWWCSILCSGVMLVEHWKYYRSARPLQGVESSLICGELPAGQVNLFSIVKEECQVLKKYLTWVNSICKRTQRRFLKNQPSIWKKRFCVYMLCEWSVENSKLEITRKFLEPGFSLSPGWEDK